MLPRESSFERCEVMRKEGRTLLVGFGFVWALGIDWGTVIILFKKWVCSNNNFITSAHARCGLNFLSWKEIIKNQARSSGEAIIWVHLAFLGGLGIG